MWTEHIKTVRQFISFSTIPWLCLHLKKKKKHFSAARLCGFRYILLKKKKNFSYKPITQIESYDYDNRIFPETEFDAFWWL